MRSINEYFEVISQTVDSNHNDNDDNSNNHENNDNIENDDSTENEKFKIIQKSTENRKYNEGKETRNHTFCQNIIIIDGKNYKCHSHARPNRFKVNHDCSEFIKREKPNIENFLTSQTSLKFLETSKLSLEDHVALVCAQLNFSIKSICSEEFHDLLYHFIRVGQESVKFERYPKAFTIYMARDRSKLRSRIIDLSQSSLLTQCKLASISSPLAAALDGGTVAHNHFVDVLLNDIMFKSGTFLFESYTYPFFNAKTYLNIGKDIIDKALMNGIKISCFVGDRLRSQMKGLDHLNPYSLQNTYNDNPLYSSILYIPCICHILNRSLLKVIQKNDKFKNSVNLLNSLQVLLRKPGFYSTIKKFMPSLIETRWIYLFDVSFWAIANKNLINSILIKSENPTLKKYLKKARFSIFQNGIPKILEEVAFIMMPIKVFF